MKVAPIRIEFCGGIGTGKSTVARLLAAHCGFPFVEEHYDEVPFWKDYYRDPPAFAFEKNISFLLFHNNAIRAVSEQMEAMPIICDFAMFQDLSYAALAGNEDDYFVTVAVHDQLITRLGRPDLLIHVRCCPDVQLERIRRRGREPERSITKAYLEDLSRHIETELARHLSLIPIIEIDTDRHDFVVDPSAGLLTLMPKFQTLLDMIQTRTKRGG
jgi:deoxyguanosine kinase